MSAAELRISQVRWIGPFLDTWNLLLVTSDCSGGPPEQSDHDSLDDEFGGGQQVRVARVFGAQERASALVQEAFEGGFAVNEGGDDLARCGFTRGEEDDVVLEDVGTDHGVAAHPQAEHPAVAAQAERSGIDGHGFVGLDFLGVGGGQSGRDDPEDRDREQPAAAPRGGAMARRGQREGAGLAGLAGEGALFFQRLEVAGGSEGTGKTEVRLDFPQGGKQSEAFVLSAHEIKHGLLAVG